MALFQQSVISHYLKELDQTKVLAAFRALKENFNLEVQVNLLKTKEEEYQEGFIMDLFVSSFGYIRKPKANWTIRMEKKSIDDNTKADAVIVNNS